MGTAGIYKGNKFSTLVQSGLLLTLYCPILTELGFNSGERFKLNTGVGNNILMAAFNVF